MDEVQVHFDSLGMYIYIARAIYMQSLKPRPPLGMLADKLLDHFEWYSIFKIRTIAFIFFI